MGVEGLKCAVTGGNGFVGRRLVEMLVERGAKKVVSFDVTPRPADSLESPCVEYIQGDIGNIEDVERVVKGADCVWHIAALVGPFHPFERYERVNYYGTLNVIEACKKQKVPKIVMSSSPSTRFDGNDIDGLRDCDMPIRAKGQFLEPYAETKAMGEIALRNACCDELMTVAIAPHQVYGPRDQLFLPALMSAAYTQRLRIFGNGKNKVSFTYVDNYCHGLILGYDALYPNSPALGKFYVVTDGDYQIFWDVMDRGAVEMGYPSIAAKAHLPYWLLHRFKLNPFTLKMLTIHRWFDITPAKTDLKYEPLYTFDDAWKKTMEWMANNRTYEKGAANPTKVADHGKSAKEE